MTLTTSRALVEAGLLAPERGEEAARVGERYAVAVTPALAGLIDRRDPDDPIARQVLPDARELERHEAERDDPIGDDLKSPVPGLVHRYPDRVLLKLARVCAVYCRFCFRREMVGPGRASALAPAELDAALLYIREHPEIWEVIVTGGDPLVLSPRRIREVTRALAAIDHVKVVRWHTRVPVAAPDRVTDRLVSALQCPGKAVYVAVHANHPREMTSAARAACARFIDRGIPMVSQTVLLRGVNDSVETLIALMRCFVEARIKPYYLHHPDLAPGTGHFRVSIAEGQKLVRALREKLSGLAQPTYVLDIPGAHGKVPVGPGYVAAGDEAGRYVIADPCGGRHIYEDVCTGPQLPR